MIGFVISLLLVLATATSIAVLAPAMRQAFRAYGELRVALALCADERLVTVRFADTAKAPARPRRRQTRARTSTQPIRKIALRAAA